MHDIYDCVDSFIELLDTEYHFILGRKRASVTIHLSFDKRDCFHLMGLQYLKDRPELNKDRGKIFDGIRKRKITKEQIESSDWYGRIADRINMLPYLEEIFDSNETVFKYNRKVNAFSMIQADYLMKNRITDRTVFVFLSNRKGDQYFCRSFFPETTYDYSKGQASWTLLYKEKIRVSKDQREILYDRLKRDIAHKKETE